MFSLVPKTLALLAILATTLLGAEVSAATFHHWIAMSNTAISITGDVQFSPSSILFANHTKLKLTPAGSAEGLTWFDSMRGEPVELYKIAGWKNPRLLNRNYLCGARVQPTFLSVLEHGDDVFLTVFSGNEVPTTKDYESHICAGLSDSLK